MHGYLLKEIIFLGVALEDFDDKP